MLRLECTLSIDWLTTVPETGEVSYYLLSVGSTLILDGGARSRLHDRFYEVVDDLHMLWVRCISLVGLHRGEVGKPSACAVFPRWVALPAWQLQVHAKPAD